MKESILKLRYQGKTYNEISKLTGASKGTISYHCSKISKDNYHKRSYERRVEMRKNAKLSLGGKCSICNYSKCLEALDFHHINPETKIEHVSVLFSNGSLSRAMKETEKCVLLCANCHRELHASRFI